MKMNKPKFWEDSNSLIPFFLFPFAFFFQIILKIKKIITVKERFNIPIICIGNIYLGGTGKTPLSILIAEELKKIKKKPAIIKKYYSDHADEHLLIKSKLNCLFINHQRSKAINDAQEKKFDVAILDDGFQDFSINKNLNLLCFNNEQLIGNGWTLPAGPLRENLSSLKRVNIILINGKKNLEFEKKVFKFSNKIKIFYSKYLPLNLKNFKNKKLLAFAGIGNPNNFFKILSEHKLQVKKKYQFPDHYNFNKSELQSMIDLSKKNNYQIITTEKDYYRIKHYGFKNIKYLKIELKIPEKDKLIKEIQKFL